MRSAYQVPSSHPNRMASHLLRASASSIVHGRSYTQNACTPRPLSITKVAGGSLVCGSPCVASRTNRLAVLRGGLEANRVGVEVAADAVGDVLLPRLGDALAEGDRQ
jgi:hypothetical protein